MQQKPRAEIPHWILLNCIFTAALLRQKPVGIHPYACEQLVKYAHTFTWTKGPKASMWDRREQSLLTTDDRHENVKSFIIHFPALHLRTIIKEKDISWLEMERERPDFHLFFTNNEGPRCFLYAYDCTLYCCESGRKGQKRIHIAPIWTACQLCA